MMFAKGMQLVICLGLLVLACVSSGASTIKDRLACNVSETAPATRVDTSKRLAEFRALLPGLQLSAFVVGSADAFNSEYTSEYDKRRGYMTGFSGSAGTAVITAEKAALWTDSRYFTEADQAMDCNWILMKSGKPETPSIVEWLDAVIADKPASIGVDRSLINQYHFQSYNKSKFVKSKRLVLKAIPSSENPVDKIWTTGRPEQPKEPIFALPLKFAGKSWQDKIKDLRGEMEFKNALAFVVSPLDDNAWLFNLRGSDVPFTPVFLATSIIEMDRIRLYILDKENRLKSMPSDSAWENKTLADHLGTSPNGSCKGTALCVEVHDLNLDDIVHDVSQVAGKVWISADTNYGILKAVSDDHLLTISPVTLAKSIKNPTEVKGMHDSYHRDSAILIKFLAFMEKQIQYGEKKWTEMSAGKEVDDRRGKDKYSRGISFETISGYGSNGALPHYRVTKATDKVISTDSMWVLDSGGQYLDGTTDVTRTMHYGEPTAYQKECYTRVLASSVNLARLRWPAGLYGNQIDVMTRHQLWEVGLEYMHGTGHGVGAYLAIHEGPAGIGQGLGFSSSPMQKLKKYQFYSDEPGFYEDGKFGIRLETVMMVDSYKTKYNPLQLEFLTLQPVQLVPFESKLIDYSILNAIQIEWLNDYNSLIKKTILPMLKSDSLATEWVEARTQTVSLGSPDTASDMTPSGFVLFITATLLVSFYHC